MLLTRQGISLGHVIDFIRISSLEIKVILLTLHVAMQIGLYLHRIKFGVWHVVSEDSDHLWARLTVIHRLQTLDALRTLRNHKLMSHLESGSIASSI